MVDRSAPRLSGVLTLLGSALSAQLGAATGSLAFPLIGPVGVVVVRQLVAAVVLLAVVRPKLWRFSWRQWWPVLLLALVFATMNLSLYYAIDRIGLGLAVTLEFLGPLAIALLGLRSRANIVCALAATGGVVAITHPDATTDLLGVGLALLAAACWAFYILLNRSIGERLSGAQGPAAATAVSATLYLPIGIVLFVSEPPSLFAILCAVGAGVLASAIPHVLDLIALRRVPAGLFGILMSVQPIFAALVGVLLLAEKLEPVEVAGIVLIVGANATALLLARPTGNARRQERKSESESVAQMSQLNAAL